MKSTKSLIYLFIFMLITLAGDWIKLLVNKDGHDGSLNTVKKQTKYTSMRTNGNELVRGEGGARNVWKPLKYLHKS